MHGIRLVAAIAIALPFTIHANPVPRGTAVLADGRCEAGEWADARPIALAGNAKLLVKQAGDFAYLCVQPAKATWFGVDLYAAPARGAPFNLHASAKLGERHWTDGKWSAFSWWNNAGWIANTSRGIAFEKREFMPDEAKEFQVRLDRFGKGEVKLMVEQHADESTVSPAGAKSDNPAGWFTLTFG